MLNSSNQPKPETSGKRHLLQTLPLRLQINSEQFNTSDIRNLLTSHSTNTPRIVSSRSPKNTNQRFKILISRISDFTDNQQINKAVSSAETTSDRLKIIDFIIKRRIEINNLAIQTKLEKAAPLIKNLQQSFKLKLSNHQGGRQTNKFKTFIRHLKPEDKDNETPPKPTRSSNHTSRFTFAPGKIEELLPHLKNNKHRPSIEINAPSAMEKLMFSSATPRHEYILSPDGQRVASTASPTPRDDNFLGTPLLGPEGPDSRRSSGIPITHNQILEKWNKTESLKSRPEEIRSWLVKEKQIKHVIKYNKNIASKSARDEAEKTVERDLCRYLLRNSENEQEILSTFKSQGGKEPMIRKIERKALDYYESLQTRRATEGDTSRDMNKALQSISQSERKSIFLKKK